MKSDVVRLRITPELKEKIIAAAEMENRTISNWIENLIKNELAEEKRIMDKYTINGETYELRITQDAYLSGTNDHPVYEGTATDKNGMEYNLTWEILEDYNPENGEENACDWSKPVNIQRLF